MAKRLNQVTIGPARRTAGGGIVATAGGRIAPEAQTERKRNAAAASSAQVPSMQDRGLYHAADAMRDMYDMGDAPSCNACGAIMVRNGSCYRCMSCGSTSGCS